MPVAIILASGYISVEQWKHCLDYYLYSSPCNDKNGLGVYCVIRSNLRDLSYLTSDLCCGLLSVSLRSVLVEKFKGSSSDSEVMVLGQMLHAVFQATVVKVQRMEVRARQPRVLERVIRQEARKCCTSLKMLESL